MSLVSVPASSRLRALGTYVFISTRDERDLSTAEDVVREVTSDIDETCSRFRDDSDLTRVNRHPGAWVEVDPLLVAAVKSACAAARQTDGLVNPLLGRPMELLGYDRDFSLLGNADDKPGLGAPLVPDAAAWQQIGWNDQEAVLRIPSGTALDLGATAKAWAADLIGAVFVEALRAPALVSLGGDIRISERDGMSWTIAVGQSPSSEADVDVELDAGGLATSSTQVRRWRRGGTERHHLIDPRKGLPAREVWTTVTTTGPSCTAANVASTAAIVLGREAPHWLARRGVTARLVAADGKVTTVGSWPRSDVTPHD